MKVYIAAPFFNAQQLEVVKHIENELTVKQIEFFSPRSIGILKHMTDEEKKRQRTIIFNNNLTAMHGCTHMIACIEDRDTGTIFEVGYFCAHLKPIVLFLKDVSLVSVMLSEAAISVCDEYHMLREALHGTYTVNIDDVI